MRMASPVPVVSVRPESSGRTEHADNQTLCRLQLNDNEYSSLMRRLTVGSTEIGSDACDRVNESISHSLWHRIQCQVIAWKLRITLPRLTTDPLHLSLGDWIGRIISSSATDECCWDMCARTHHRIGCITIPLSTRTGDLLCS